MDLDITIDQRVKTLKQRNIALIFLAISLVSNLILAVILVAKDERVIIVPTHLKEPFWVGTYSVSNKYLEERAALIIDRMLNVHSSNFQGNMEFVMRFVTPNSEAHQELYEQMLSRHENIKKLGLSSSFYLSEIKTNGEKFEATVEGKLIQYLSGEKSLEAKKKYWLQFDYKYGDLTLKQFKEIK